MGSNPTPASKTLTNLYRRALTACEDSVKIGYMYAVYGLDENRENIETFIGYVPATFFESFTDPTGWQVKWIDLPDGEKGLGRIYNRALFVQQTNLRASKEEIARYMDVCPDSDGIREANVRV